MFLENDIYQINMVIKVKSSFIYCMHISMLVMNAWKCNKHNTREIFEFRRIDCILNKFIV